VNRRAGCDNFARPAPWESRGRNPLGRPDHQSAQYPLYAETTAATLQRRFDRLTDPAAHALVSSIRQQQGDEVALLAAELLAQRRAERISRADA